MNIIIIIINIIIMLASDDVAVWGHAALPRAAPRAISARR